MLATFFGKSKQIVPAYKEENSEKHVAVILPELVERSGDNQKPRPNYANTGNTGSTLRLRREPFKRNRGSYHGHGAETHHAGHEQDHHEPGAAQTAMHAQAEAVLPGAPSLRRQRWLASWRLSALPKLSSLSRVELLTPGVPTLSAEEIGAVMR
jgi:hypothetical protein